MQALNEPSGVAGAIHPVVLSGGSGTRLWPLSRQAFPKQFLPLTGERSLLQETLARTAGVAGFARAMVVCSDEHRFLVAEQCRQLGGLPEIVLEPQGRNTAPAIAAAAILLSGQDPEALLLVQPSDHRILDAGGFRAAVGRAAAAARRGRLVTFGIRPDKPETGYGYIRAGAAADDGVFAVDGFTEKPDGETAARYCTSGSHHWNSGIFLLSAATLLAELERLEPELLVACRRAVAAGGRDGDFFRLEDTAFAQCRSVSVDYALMEKTRLASVVPVDIGWSDVGSWSALHATRPQDDDGNAVDGDVDLEDARGCYVRSEGPLVSAIGVEDLVIVATPDAVLVTAAGRAGDVGKTVERLRRRNRQEALHHPRVARPWGSYRTVDRGERFQVKRITVSPGASLSLQMHHHRAEHWVVVQGTARVQRDRDSLLVRENESVYIPLGATHRLENPGKLPLHLIEVQSGGYLGEDDIVRFADDYGRR